MLLLLHMFKASLLDNWHTPPVHYVLKDGQNTGVFLEVPAQQ